MNDSVNRRRRREGRNKDIKRRGKGISHKATERIYSVNDNESDTRTQDKKAYAMVESERKTDEENDTV